MLLDMVEFTSNINSSPVSATDLFPLSPSELRALLAQQSTPTS
ncbi:MAG: hypothetical protein ACI9PY_002663 [Ascidiaceihabitans sp.]|jgi:hypothetical protein